MSIEQEVPAAEPSFRQVRIEEVNEDLELSYRPQRWGEAGCLSLWLTGWSAGCIMLVGKTLSDPSFFHILAAIPFLASWFFVFGILVWMLFGVERVRLGLEGLDYRTTALVGLSRRTVPRTELKGVRADVRVRNKATEPCLTFETQGQPIHFAAGISEQEQRWLIERLNDYLNTLGPLEAPNGPGAASICKQITSPGEILQAAAIPLEPLSESRINVRYHADAVAFIWQGERSMSAMAGITFFNLFWNGIVGLFLYKQVQDWNWFLFFFMIPHEIIGLCIFALWLAALTAPAWRLTWTFGERQVTRHLSVSDADAIVFNFSWSKRFDIRPPVRIELRRREEKKQSGSLWALLSHPDGEYILSFRGEDAKKMPAIKHLTEGDGRWIADVLLRAFPSWSEPERGNVLGPDETDGMILTGKRHES